MHHLSPNPISLLHNVPRVYGAAKGDAVSIQLVLAEIMEYREGGNIDAGVLASRSDDG